MSDLTIQELAPGKYHGLIDKIEFSGKSDVKITIFYKIDTPDGVRRLKERELLKASPSSASHFHTA